MVGNELAHRLHAGSLDLHVMGAFALSMVDHLAFAVGSLIGSGKTTT